MEFTTALIATLVIALLAVFTVLRAVRIVPQARARNVERLGRYHRTLQPGLNFVIPYVDRVHPKIDLREQVVSFQPQPVITEDNLVVEIDTVLYFQVTDPRAAAYEIASYLQAVEQLTVTTLRNVVGSMDLEKTLTSRDTINSQLRGVLDDATGKWGLRVNRVEIKAIDPPATIKDAMEKQMRAERAKRAAILAAEGQRQSQILTAEGDKQAAVLRAEGNRAAEILKAEGQARAIDQVFQAVHRNDPDPKLLAYHYLQTLPKLAEGPGNTLFVIPSEVTTALSSVSQAFAETLPKSPATRHTAVPDDLADRAADHAAQAAAAAVADAAQAETSTSQPSPTTIHVPTPGDDDRKSHADRTASNHHAHLIAPPRS
ncbi:SPFH domain-containing protein [Actinosynnema sp. NPDC002837]